MVLDSTEGPILNFSPLAAFESFFGRMVPLGGRAGVEESFPPGRGTSAGGIISDNKDRPHCSSTPALASLFES